MQLAILREDLENIAGLIRKETVIGDNDRRATSGLENRHHVLDEIELFVAR